MQTTEGDFFKQHHLTCAVACRTFFIDLCECSTFTNKMHMLAIQVAKTVITKIANKDGSHNNNDAKVEQLEVEVQRLEQQINHLQNPMQDGSSTSGNQQLSLSNQPNSSQNFSFERDRQLQQQQQQQRNKGGFGRGGRGRRGRGSRFN